MAGAAAEYYSQLSQTKLSFYDGTPTSQTPATIRSEIVADTTITGGVSSFTFKGASAGRALLRNVAEPQLTTDAATKYYVDSVASGLTVKGAVTLRTMGNIPGVTYGTNGELANSQLSASGSFGDLLASIFDIAVSEADAATKKISETSFAYVADSDETVATRFLVMDQTNKKQNGVYYLAEAGGASTSWKLVRATNFNDNPSGEIKAGSFVFVTDGNKHKNHGFVLIADGGETILRTTLSTAADNNDLHFEQFSGAGQLKAGDNIVITGDTVALDTVVSGLTSITTAALDVTGTAVVGTTLGVSGATTLGSTLGVASATTLASTLDVSGLVTAKQGVYVQSGGIVVGTLSVTNRTEAVRVKGSEYIEGDVTLTGIVTASGTGRSVFSDQVLVGSYTTDPASSAKLSVSGATYVHGGFTANGATTLKNTLTTEGAITAEDTALFKKAVTVDALTRTKTLLVDSTATITGATELQSTLGVSGATTLSSTLEVSGGATLKSSLVVSGDTAITGKSSTGGTSRLVGRVEVGSALSVTDLSLYNGTSYADRSAALLGVKGGVWVDGTLRVMDTCVLAKEGTAVVDIGATSITGTAELATRGASKFRVAGDAYVDGVLYAGGAAKVGGNLEVTGTATVTGVTHLQARTDIGTRPSSGQSGAMLAVYGTLDVTGTTLLRDDVHIGSTLTTTQQTAGGAWITDASLVVNGHAYVEDNVVVNKDFRVNGDSTFVDAVTISGITNLGAFVTATPATAAVGLTPGTSASLTVTGNTTFSGSSTEKTTVTTLFDVTNTAKFTSPVYVENTFTVGKTGAGNQHKSTFYGAVEVNDGDLVVNPGSGTTHKKLLATGVNSVIGNIRFGLNNDHASISSTLTNTTVSFVDNNLTTTGDVTCKNVAASENVTATKKGTFNEGCYSSNFYATSDARLKRDVSTVTGALEKCSRLRGVTFKWVAGEDQRDQLGVIAQETQQVYPSLVSEHEGYLRVDYPKLVGLLIEAVKELDERTRPVASA